MKLAFATLGCPNWTVEQIATNAKAMGYDGVELRGISKEHVGAELTAAERTRVRELFASAGVEICAIMGYSRYALTDAAVIKSNTAAAIELIDLAHDLGCPIQRVFIGTPEGSFDVDGLIKVCIENLKRVSGHAEKVGVQLAIETHDQWLTGEVLRRIMDGTGSPQVGACWDVGNTYTYGHQQDEMFNALNGRIIHVHFKDLRLEDSKPKYVLSGEGEVDLLGALKLLQRAGYDGYYSFEWEKRWIPELAEPEIALPVYVKHCAQLQRQMKMRAE